MLMFTLTDHQLADMLNKAIDYVVKNIPKDSPPKGWRWLPVAVGFRSDNIGTITYDIRWDLTADV